METNSSVKSFLKDLIKRKEERGLLGFESATLVYIAITIVIIIVEWAKLSNPVSMLTARAIYVIAIAAGMRAPKSSRMLPRAYLLVSGNVFVL